MCEHNASFRTNCLYFDCIRCFSATGQAILNISLFHSRNDEQPKHGYIRPENHNDPHGLLRRIKGTTVVIGVAITLRVVYLTLSITL